MKAIGSLLGLLGVIIAVGCGGPPSPRLGADASAQAGATPRRALSPMSLEIAVVSARGAVSVRRGVHWEPLAEGATRGGVRELRVERQGAIVSLGHGDAAGRLWLRGGSHVQLGQDERGGVHVAVVAGHARLRRGTAALPAYVDSADRATAITGDYLVSASAMMPTGTRPELADWSLALEHDEEGAGVGRMEARVDAAHTEPLVLREVSVDVHTAGDMALTEVEHVFWNPAAENREGTFRFPVPDGALLIGMAMEVHGKMVEGEIVERDKARATYEKIVDEMQDPALLEWEEGNWFKLRVFPIEANDDKRVVIRYVAPLAHRGAGWEYELSLGVPDPGAPIGELTVTVDGKVAARERAVAHGLDLAVPIDAARVPAVMRELRADGVYTAVRISPDAAKLAAPPPGGDRKVAIVFDTSRSTLESKALATELLRKTLAELGTHDTFVVLASDVAVTPSAPELVAAMPGAIDRAVAFIDAIEPDGASDLGAALAAVAALHPTDVMYIGDGIPTWGERGQAALAMQAEQIGAPIHAALLGKGATAAPWAEIAGRTGGRAMMVKRPIDAERFALAAAHAREVPRLSGARIEAPSGAVVFPAHAQTVYAGDQLLALVRTPAGQPAPHAVTMTGTVAGRPYRQDVTLGAAVDVPRVAQRWATYQLAAMDAAGAPREDIVKLSQDYGVLSRHTSLLVLENDEAYQQHQIERRNGEPQLAQAQAPRVTGGDLDSLGARRAQLSPDEIQPGDPEIKIPAPLDARSVVVTLPFGETKQAVWDRDVSAWMVRFLIDKDTPDGEYQVRVAITHADGRVEVLHLPYTVDTRAPAVDVSAARVANGYRIRARQRAEAGRMDAERIEVTLPDGEVLALEQTAWGRFEAVWETAALVAPVTLRVVVHDRALNQGVGELVTGEAN